MEYRVFGKAEIAFEVIIEAGSLEDALAVLEQASDVNLIVQVDVEGDEQDVAVVDRSVDWIRAEPALSKNEYEKILSEKENKPIAMADIDNQFSLAKTPDEIENTKEKLCIKYSHLKRYILNMATIRSDEL